ncbi:MAG TPA: hypothetical protein VKF38_17415, partial [Anaerolineaceae bacterium]|nr:hypothetical protein [Anaerolineaceae bacterium]
MLILADVLEALTNTRLEGASLNISEASVDSRQVLPASMFVALPDEQVDQLANVDQAFKNGAQLAVVQKDISSQYPVVDIRLGKLPESFVLPQQPFCLW